LALRAAAREFGDLAGYRPAPVTLSEPRVSAEWLQVSANLFDVLGVQPIRGRAFRPDDEIPGNERVALISTALWTDQFAGAPDIVGRTVRADGETYEVIGVLPPSASDHRLFGRTGLFSPLTIRDAERGDRTARTITVLGRRAAAVSDAQGRSFVASMGSRMAEQAAERADGVTWRMEGLPESNTGPTGRAILGMLLGLSTFVLLIACANLANLLFVRAVGRAREFAVRTALGASRVQLTRMVVLESLLLAAAGGAGALLVARWTTSWLQSTIVDGGGPAIPVDWRVLGFAAASSAATVLFCGVAPALFVRASVRAAC
jgi:hypothetical protein